MSDPRDWDEPWSINAAGASEAANEEAEFRAECCGRPVQVDQLRGRPSNHSTYCLGTDTCLQRKEDSK